MSVLKMAEQIKKIHPDFIVLYKIGIFYHAYGKDSYIISSKFNYNIKQNNNINDCGFSNNVINKVKSKLEDNKINYMLVDPRNNYDVDEKQDFGNLNNYEKEFKKSYLIIKRRREIEKISERLNYLIEKEEFKNIIRKIEDVLDENGEI